MGKRVPSIVNFVFDGPPGPEGPRFIETELLDGTGVGVGTWMQRESDGCWVLQIDPTEGWPTEETVDFDEHDGEQTLFEAAGEPDPAYAHRSAVTGEFVTEEFAAENPNTTVREKLDG